MDDREHGFGGAVMGRRCCRMWKKIVCSGVVFAVVGLIACMAVVNYRYTHPEWAFSATAAECARRGVFGEKQYYAIGPEVERMAMERGVPPERAECVLAVRGYEVVRFKPDRFHAVYGSLELRRVDPGVVNFYFYHPRYRPNFGG